MIQSILQIQEMGYFSPSCVSHIQRLNYQLFNGLTIRPQSQIYQRIYPYFFQSPNI
ncbi:hypothetical protein pb186bvf_007557 [Paramecium bursaria]